MPPAPSPSWHSTRSRFLYLSRCAVAGLLYYSGALAAYAWFSRRQARVLTYHRVLNDEQHTKHWSQPAIVVRTRTFERQMAILRRYFDVVDVTAFSGRRAGRTMGSRPACLVTFDDGWSDTWTEAFPILRQYSIPALVFLPVRFIGTDRRFWQEQLADDLYRLWSRAQLGHASSFAVGEALAAMGAADVLAADADHVRQTILRRVNAIKARPAADIDVVVRDVRALVGSADHAHHDGFMSWHEVREMARHGVDFGGHGAEHLILTKVEKTQAAADIHASKQTLSEQLPTAVDVFSYPNGDWNADVVAYVRDAGYRMAFATDRDGGDDFTIRRTNISESSTHYAPLFLARSLGVM